MIEPAELKTQTAEELEALYVEDHGLELAPPAGSFLGKNLGWMPRTKGEHLLVRPVLKLGFEIIPFGVDFDQRRWFFAHAKSPRIGKFTTRVGKSRWHDTNALQLHYDVSRLPRRLKTLLYDEIKPLSSDLYLGIGGFMAPPGPGMQFFFALVRQLERGSAAKHGHAKEPSSKLVSLG